MDKLNFKLGQFVIGQDEYTYQEVLDDFENADFIGILTYNITSDGSILLDKLKAACKTGTSAVVITSIPNYFKSYWGNAAQKARDNMGAYIKALNPENYDGMLTPYFHLSNHAKIVMTNNVLYWGSGNYSDASGKNVECGTISRDPELIAYVRERLFPKLADEAVPYYSPKTIQAAIEMKKASNLCQKVKEKVTEEIFYPWSDYDTGFKEVWIFQTENAGYAARVFRRFVEELQKYEDSLDVIQEVIEYHVFSDNPSAELIQLTELYENFCSTYGKIKENIEALYDDIDEIARFNAGDEVDRILNEDYGMVAYEEDLEYYIDKAMTEVHSDYSELAEAAEPAIKEILDQIAKMEDFFFELHKSLSQMLNTLGRINNTGIK